MPLGPEDVLFLWVSPFFGMFIPMAWVTRTSGYINTLRDVAMFVWIALTSVLAYAILLVTVASFDRLLGRMPVVRTADTDGPWPRSVAIGQPRQAHRSPS
jgi:hypothetical protein